MRAMGHDLRLGSRRDQRSDTDTAYESQRQMAQTLTDLMELWRDALDSLRC